MQYTGGCGQQDLIKKRITGNLQENLELIFYLIVGAFPISLLFNQSQDLTYSHFCLAHSTFPALLTKTIQCFWFLSLLETQDLDTLLCQLQMLRHLVFRLNPSLPMSTKAMGHSRINPA